MPIRYSPLSEKVFRGMLGLWDHTRNLPHLWKCPYLLSCESTRVPWPSPKCPIFPGYPGHVTSPCSFQTPGNPTPSPHTKTPFAPSQSQASYSHPSAGEARSAAPVRLPPRPPPKKLLPPPARAQPPAPPDPPVPSVGAARRGAAHGQSGGPAVRTAPSGGGRPARPPGGTLPRVGIGTTAAPRRYPLRERAGNRQLGRKEAGRLPGLRLGDGCTTNLQERMDGSRSTAEREVGSFRRLGR